MAEAVIITTGDELLIGQIVDTNSMWIAKQLNGVGIAVRRKMSVGDHKEEIIQALVEALSVADLVVLTGGLGPTKDDVTKDSLNTFFGGKLVQNKRVLKRIHEIFQTQNKPVFFHNLKQAEVPDNCEVLFNRFGTAPGMLFERDGKIVISMPGVPFEMKPIFTDALAELVKRFQKKAIFHQTLLVTRMGESAASDLLSDIEAALPQFFRIAYLPALGYLRIRVSGYGEEQSEVETRVKNEVAKIRFRLGKHCIALGEQSIEEVLAELFVRNRRTLGIAESCTGGLLSHKITNVPGCSRFFNGSVVTYHNQLKQDLLSVSDRILTSQGAVSEAAVVQMALSARDLLRADYTIATSGILGPTGATDAKPVGLVWMAIATKDRHLSKQFHFRFDRRENKELAVNAGLDWLRQILLEEEESAGK